MKRKKDILKNLHEFSPEEIAGFIRKGVVTQDELQNNSDGQYTPFFKYMVEEALSNWVEETLQPEKVEPVITDTADNHIETATETLLTTQNDTGVIPKEFEPLTSANEENVPQTTSPMEDGSTIHPPDVNSMFGPFSFSGRIGRTEYWLTIIILSLINIFLTFMIVNAGGPDDGVIVAYLIYLIISSWLMIAQSTKRCHDLGHSGWWQLIPFYGLWLLFDKGDGENPNEYGESTKQHK